MKKSRREVKMVVEQGDRRGSRARVFGYGYEAVGRLVGRSVVSVKRHEKAGAVDMESLVSVVEYVGRSKNKDGRNELAKRLRLVIKCEIGSYESNDAGMVGMVDGVLARVMGVLID